jgi:predicted metal-dependent peptidase
MKPSRRYGFSAMGSRYERKAQILIAVDVSGSISDESFNNFCHAIKNFFYLKIIEKIDLIFFDVNLIYTKPITFNKKVDFNAISGRGGTNFQIPFDYYNEHKSIYNGMIIFTDGEGNIPVTFGHSNILWILDSYESYSKNNTWINALNNNKCTYLPF